MLKSVQPLSPSLLFLSALQNPGKLSTCLNLSALQNPRKLSTCLNLSALQNPRKLSTCLNLSTLQKPAKLSTCLNLSALQNPAKLSTCLNSSLQLSSLFKHYPTLLFFIFVHFLCQSIAPINPLQLFNTNYLHFSGSAIALTSIQAPLVAYLPSVNAQPPTSTLTYPTVTSTFIIPGNYVIIH